MGQIELLQELTLIAALGVVVTVIFARLRLPTVAGLLVAGALLGPSGFHLVSSTHSIETLAEIGVVLLLFTIGLEFPLERLAHIFRQVALGGVLQVGLTVGVAVIVAAVLGEPGGRGVFYGFVFSLSSTAIVLRALTDRRESNAPHGRFILGALIFQDLCVVPMVLVVPLLGGTGAAGKGAIALALGKAALVVIAIVLVSRRIVRPLLAFVDQSRSREVFLMAVLALCIGTAWLTSLVGLSLALGAFLGGVMVAGTEYGHRAMGDVLPLRDVFVSIFFVSLGMLFDGQILLERPGLVVLLLAGFVLAKGALATVAALAMRFPARVAWLAGVGLAQFGEFGFVLCRLGEASGVVNHEATRPLLTAGIASMVLTPVLVGLAPHFTAGERLLAPLARLIGARGIEDEDTGGAGFSDHVIIVGFGVAGRLVARALQASGVSYVGLELNAETVRAARERGEPVFYADATSAEALGHAHVAKARAVALLISDPQGVQRIVDTVRRVAPSVPILVRVHYMHEKPAVLRLGATDTVAEEVEGGVEVLARLLRWLDVPRNVIDQRVHEIRGETQATERTQTVPRKVLGDHEALAELKIESVKVTAGSIALGRSLGELDLRRRTDASVVAVRRAGVLLEHPIPNTIFEDGDIVYLIGSVYAVRAAIDLLTRTPEDGALS